MPRTRLLALLAITMVAGLMVTGCKSPMGLTDDIGTASHWVLGGPEVFTLWAGQNIDAGKVTVWNTEQTLYIKYQTTGNWWLEETHAHVALSVDGIPHSKGGPIPGKFEFSNTYNPRVQTETYTIPIGDRDGWKDGVDLYIATHCVVSQLINGKYKNQQTGWAGPYDYPGKNWAKYIKYKFTAYKDVTLPTVLPNPADSVEMSVYDDLNLPALTTVARFRVALKDVPDGYDVWNAPGPNFDPPYWGGWCAEHANGITPSGVYGTAWYHVRLWSSQSESLPDRDKLETGAWGNVNYLLNHKDPEATVYEIQVAIWWLMTPHDPTLLPDHPLVGRAKAMHDEAEKFGNGWRPIPGAHQVLAVICDAPNYPDGTPVQRVFIEVDP